MASILKKRFFLRSSVDYLRHLIRQGNPSVNAKKYKSVQHIFPSRIQTDIKSLLLLCNVFKRFSPVFAGIAVPFTAIIYKDKPSKMDQLVDSSALCPAPLTDLNLFNSAFTGKICTLMSISTNTTFIRLVELQCTSTPLSQLTARSLPPHPTPVYTVSTGVEET